MQNRVEALLDLNRRVHAEVTAMCGASGSAAEGHDLNECYFVPIALLARALGHQNAMACLVREAHAMEAAIIALSQLELCLDIMYIEQDPLRATAWMQHTSDRRQPWGVEKKLRELYANDAAALSANQEAYQLLSQVKHANPRSGAYGFPARQTGTRLTIQTNPDPDDFSRAWASTALGFSCYKLLEAAVAVKRCHGLFVEIDDDFDARLTDLRSECRRQLAALMPSDSERAPEG